MSTTESSPTEIEADGVIEKENAQMRQRWDKTKGKELGISNHYTSVAALIVHWAKELDKDLNCGKEVCLASTDITTLLILIGFRLRTYMRSSRRNFVSTRKWSL